MLLPARASVEGVKLAMNGPRKPHRLADGEAIQRLREVLKLTVRDLVTCLHLEAVMKSGNEIVTTPHTDFSDEFGGVYRTLHFSLMASLAMTLAKLFEEPKPRRKQSLREAHNRSDKASLPTLTHLLKQRRCQKRLIQDSRNWSPPFADMTDYDEREVSSAITASLQAYASFRRDPGNRRAVRRLRTIRNHALAHSLRGAPGHDYPQYNELFVLCRAAESVVGPAEYAIDGHHVDYQDEHTAHYTHVGREFWRSALVERSD